MFELRVTGLAEANELIREGWPTRIVSLMSDDVVVQGTHHLYIKVNDIIFVDNDATHPTIEHLRQAIDFTLGLTDDDRLLVHCFAGQSRSTAIAIAICIQYGMPYDEAYEYIASVRSILLPNQLFIALIDEHFKLDGKLIELVNMRRSQAIARALTLPSSLETVAILKETVRALD